MVSNRLVDRPRTRTSRWFGPARVLATETKGAPGERKPSAHVWIVASGRIKKAHTSQLRHASETEKLIAEASDPVVFPWTMTSLAATMNKGAYEDLTVPPLPHSRVLPTGGVPHQGGLPPEVEDLDERQGPERMTGEHQTRTGDELLEDRPRDNLKRPAPPPNVMDEEMIPEHEELDLDILSDPSYLPLGPLPPAPPHTSRAESSDFQTLQAAHEQQDRPHHVIRQEHLDQAFMASSPGGRGYTG